MLSCHPDRAEKFQWRSFESKYDHSLTEKACLSDLMAVITKSFGQSLRGL
jgi:hypothetical protein